MIVRFGFTPLSIIVGISAYKPSYDPAPCARSYIGQKRLADGMSHVTPYTNGPLHQPNLTQATVPGQ